jgi:dTDP-4-dehydrorhamnose reductase
MILGKKGMLGRELVRAFGNEDFIAYDSDELDITKQEAVFERLMTVQPTIVINATGYTNVDEAENEQEHALGVNGYSVGILAKACREIDATLVHFSTDYVFNGDKKSGYNEEAVTHPINAYGRSKELGEKLLLEEMQVLDEAMQKEGDYFLIRTSWLYGNHGKNFVDTMLKLGKEKKELKVVNDQYGKPTSAADLAQQVKWLIKSNEYPPGIYHVTNEGTTTWFELAKEIFRLAKMDVNVIACTSAEYKMAAKRPKYAALLNTKLPALRGWKEALKDYITKK